MATLQTQANAIYMYETYFLEGNLAPWNEFKKTLTAREVYESLSALVAYCRPRNGKVWTAADTLSMLDILTY